MKVGKRGYVKGTTFSFIQLLSHLEGIVEIT
jgi:hypothetical protein